SNIPVKMLYHPKIIQVRLQALNAEIWPVFQLNFKGRRSFPLHRQQLNYKIKPIAMVIISYFFSPTNRFFHQGAGIPSILIK
ncbi:MAG: hypothetical protein ABIJ35_00230, partial [Acidobacteriota bacterium]